MPSGVFEAVATGGNLTLGDAASLNAKGSAVDFRDVVRVTSGGTIRLAATGDLSIASGAAIDVSGHARGGDAGSVKIDAGGRASLAGTVTGRSEEHTSELQSLMRISYAVLCLKKKKQTSNESNYLIDQIMNDCRRICIITKNNNRNTR